MCIFFVLFCVCDEFSHTTMYPFVEASLECWVAPMSSLAAPGRCVTLNDESSMNQPTKRWKLVMKHGWSMKTWNLINNLDLLIEGFSATTHDPGFRAWWGPTKRVTSKRSTCLRKNSLAGTLGVFFSCNRTKYDSLDKNRSNQNRFDLGRWDNID